MTHTKLSRKLHQHRYALQAQHTRQGATLCLSYDIEQQNILRAAGEFRGTFSERHLSRRALFASVASHKNPLTTYVFRSFTALPKVLTSSRATSAEQVSSATHSCGVPNFCAPSNNAIKNSPGAGLATTTFSNSIGVIPSAHPDLKPNTSAPSFIPATLDLTFHPVNGCEEDRSGAGA